VNRVALAALTALVSYFALPQSRALAQSRASRPVIPGFERFYSGPGADEVRGGRLLFVELSCGKCHAFQDKAVAPKQPPILDGVAGRVRIGWLRQFLTDPQAAKPGTTMPGLFSGDPARDQKVEALVHFLASTGPLKVGHGERKRIAAGRELYHHVGCVMCHGSRNASGKQETVVATSVPLGDLSAKYSYDSLATFLENPHRVRPAGRMPKLLSAVDAKAVANYLLQGTTPPARGSSKFAYYEGSWDKIPDFAELKPVDQGTVIGFDLTPARRGDRYAIRYEGVFAADVAGKYSFSLASDDGSRLYVDGKLIVDNDGIHPPQSKSGSTQLTAGIHHVVVAYFQGGGGAELEVTIGVPGSGKFDLGDMVAPNASALKRKADAKPANDPDALQISEELAKKGRELFATIGCASCHQLSHGGSQIASSLKALPVGRLREDAGCLSSTPGLNIPRYGLDAAQRHALARGMSSPLATPPSRSELIHQTMITFNCYGCHSRNKIGGPDPALDRFVGTTQPEMGEEGRLPPPLDGVGAKLNEDYLRELLDGGVHHRPYMHTRMPGFGDANVGKLVSLFGASDHLPAAPAVTFKQPMARIKDSARHLVGGQAFGCVKCHTFAGIKAEGVQGIDMTLMTKRLQRSWFHAYILDPPSIRPGTRMPSAFYQGKSALPAVLDGDPATQIEAMWVYLKDGLKSRPPTGIGSRSIPLIPDQSAIIYRNFIEGAGPRAIGVGYPEKMNLAFDANEIRLAMLWQGAFIDAGRHWTDRGVGFEGPAGDNVLHLPEGAAFAVLPRPDAPWPTAKAKESGYRFLGYRLTPDDRPTFRYAFGEFTIEDFSNPATSGKQPLFHRALEISGPRSPTGLTFRAAVADQISDLGKGEYLIDSLLRLKIESGTKAVVRKSAGKTELLIPVRLSDGKARVDVDYAW